MRKSKWLALVMGSAAMVLLLQNARPSYGGGCRRIVQVAQPLQQFFYFVGQPVRLEAVLEKQQRDDPSYQEFLEFKQYRKRLALQTNNTPKAELKAERPSLLQRKCGRCHTGPKPRGGIRFDEKQTLPAEQIINAQRMMLAGEMPPASDARLSPEEMGDLIQELLNLVGETQ